MPTPSECEALWGERLANGYKFDHGKSVREKWPTRDEQLEYYRWSKKRADERFAEFFCTPTSREDLKEMIAKMNCNSAMDRGKLTGQPMPKTDGELVPANVLGVNTNVQPSNPARSRKADFSEMSNKSNESDDPGTSGFVFHQIGTLEVWGAERHKLQSFENAGGKRKGVNILMINILIDRRLDIP
ncbi:hypothetical protein FGG08_002673 [Glutinoglossum americanum]|uniref:Uncharacterized protein n=1 Tax=Glutinoglossum americanum TaxID=1670608 RepID=A0A9P8HZS4_9PEZI|nr:hypothetical protein FGG08_002673 [Glutinoglossum americanum]